MIPAEFPNRDTAEFIARDQLERWEWWYTVGIDDMLAEARR